MPPRSIIPNAVTAANIMAGFAAMLLAAKGRFDESVYLLVVALYLDTFDGRLARMLKATSDFGKQLDSFSDTVSFGVAPVFLVYQAILSERGAIGLGATMLYLLAGVFRLARYNLLADSHSKGRRTLGVPIPIAASYLMAVALMRDHLPPLAATLVVVIMAVCMASRWRLPELAGFGPVAVMLLIGIVNFMFVVIRPNWYTVIWWNVWNVMILVAARREERQWPLEAAQS